jgi:hypothetical protein
VANAVLNSTFTLTPPTTLATSTYAANIALVDNSLTLLGPLPDYDGLQFTCDALRMAGQSASVLDAGALGRIADADLFDCLEVLGKLPFDTVNGEGVALALWKRMTASQILPSGSLLRGNLMAMLDGLLPAIASAYPSQMDFSFKTNFDGLGQDCHLIGRFP